MVPRWRHDRCGSGPHRQDVLRHGRHHGVSGACVRRPTSERSVGERRPAQPRFQPQPGLQPEPRPQPQPGLQPPRSDGWIGKALAVSGVLVTLVGVALLLVLAAQAGLLRPEFRVLAGAALAVGLGGCGMATPAAAGWPGGLDRVVRHWCSRRLHRRHRRHDQLSVGVAAGRSGARGDRRRGRPTACPPVGLRASRSPGARPADRPCSRRRRRCHGAAGGIHAGVECGGSAGAGGQGLAGPARCADGRQHAAAGRRPGLDHLRFRALAAARGGVRAGRHTCAGQHVAPAAVRDQRDRHGAAGCRGNDAGAGDGTRRRPGHGGADGGRTVSGPARDRVRRIPAADGHRRSADRLVRPGRRNRSRRGDSGLRGPGGRARPPRAGGRHGRGWSPRAGREVVCAWFRHCRRSVPAGLRAAVDSGRGHRDGTVDRGVHPRGQRPVDHLRRGDGAVMAQRLVGIDRRGGRAYMGSRCSP